MIYLASLFRFIVDIQIRWPYLIYFPITFFVADGSLLSRFLFLAVGLAANFYYNLIPYYVTQYHHTRGASEFIEAHQSCHYQRHDFDSYLGKGVKDFNLNHFLTTKESGIKKWYNQSIKNNTYFFHVSRSTTKEFPQNAKVFTGEFGTLVFVPDSPKSLKPFAKFKLLHEYFHSSEVALFFERQLVFRNTLLILALLFALLNVSINLWTILLTVFLILLLRFEARYYWAVRKHKSIYMAEIMSDILAVKYLDDADRLSISQSPYLEILIGDNDGLTEQQNEYRRQHFINIIKHGVTDASLTDLLSQEYSPPSNVINSLVLLSMIALLFFLKEITTSLVLMNGLFLFLFLIVSMLVVRGGYVFYRDQLEKKLNIGLTQQNFFKKR